jgi:hypothetical protein
MATPEQHVTGLLQTWGGDDPAALGEERSGCSGPWAGAGWRRSAWRGTSGRAPGRGKGARVTRVHVLGIAVARRHHQVSDSRKRAGMSRKPTLSLTVPK